MRRPVRNRVCRAVILSVLTLLAPSGAATLLFKTPRQILVESGVPLVPSALIRALSHHDAEFRMYAAGVPGEDKVHTAIPELRKLLDDDFIYARFAAAGALLKMGDESGLTLLLAGTRDEDLLSAARALQELLTAGRSEGFAALVQQLQKPKTPPIGRVALTRRLAEYGRRFPAHRKAAVEALIRELREDASPSVRMEAALALNDFDEPAAVAALALAAEHDPAEEVRVQAKARRREAAEVKR